VFVMITIFSYCRAVCVPDTARDVREPSKPNVFSKSHQLSANEQLPGATVYRLPMDSCRLPGADAVKRLPGAAIDPTVPGTAARQASWSHE